MNRIMKKVTASMAVGMGIGAAVGAGLGYMTRPSGKKLIKKKAGQAADFIGEIVDGIGMMMK